MAKAKQDYKKYVEGMLECCVCLETVRDPHTLQGCFHSVCKGCLDQLLRQEARGLTCPVCRTFSAKENIRANYFVRGLAEMHISHSEKRLCEQCPNRAEPSEACSKCLDCKMDLCANCRDAHLNVRILQGHRILPLTEATEFIVDQLVFCCHHPEEPIKLFCLSCYMPVCMMCTATDHNGHKCETIQVTLEKMVPVWEKNIKYIDTKLQAVNESSDEVEKKIEQTRADFQRCVNQINEKAETRIAEIKATQGQMTDDLRTREKGEIEKLEKVRRDLAEKKRDGENVRRVVRTSLDRARHASLMTELLQEGLGQKMEAVRKWDEERIKVEVEVPGLEGGDKQMDEAMKSGLLGRVLYSTVSLLVMLGSIASRVWNVDAEEYFKNKFKLVKEMQLPYYCARITLINDHIWAPLYYSDNIQIYNKSCELINTIKIKNPVSVAQASNGDIFIACYIGSGLYIMTGMDQDPDLITAGSFQDVYPYNEKMYALNQGENAIQEYVYSENKDVKLKWSLKRSIPVHELGSYDTLVVDKSGLYVTACDKHRIHHYSETGRCIQKFTDSLQYPFLCGIDKNSNLIVAHRQAINAVKCDKGKAVALKQLGTEDVTDYRDVRLDTDGSLWVLYKNAAGKRCISKYEVVTE